MIADFELKIKEYADKEDKTTSGGYTISVAHIHIEASPKTVEKVMEALRKFPNAEVR